MYASESISLSSLLKYGLTLLGLLSINAGPLRFMQLLSVFIAFLKFFAFKIFIYILSLFSLSFCLSNFISLVKNIRPSKLLVSKS